MGQIIPPVWVEKTVIVILYSNWYKTLTCKISIFCRWKRWGTSINIVFLFLLEYSWFIPSSSAGKDSACFAGRFYLIPGSGRSPGEGTGYPIQYSWASLVAQTVKNAPALWETWIWSLGQEDPLEEGMATHSSILAWRIPWTEMPGSPWARKELDMDTTKQLSEVKWKWLSHIQLFATRWTMQSMEFSRPEYWNG